MNGIMEIRRQVRLSQWSAMVREREERGLSVKAYCKQTGIAAKTYYYRLRKLREAAVEQARFEATQPELVQYTPPAEYAVVQTQSIVIKTADTTIEIPVNAQPDVVAAAVSFLRQPRLTYVLSKRSTQFFDTFLGKKTLLTF